MKKLVVCLYTEHPDGYLVHEERMSFTELADKLKAKILQDIETEILNAITERRNYDREPDSSKEHD